LGQMPKTVLGYRGKILDVNLTIGKLAERPLEKDVVNYAWVAWVSAPRSSTMNCRLGYRPSILTTY
jgi:hypothetical protein